MAEFKNPFMDFDVQKMMGDMKVPNLDVDGIVAAQKKNFDAIAQANQVTAEGMQAIVKRQSEIMQSAITDMQASVQTLAGQGAPEEKMAKQAETVKTMFEQSLHTMKELSDMLTKSNAEATDIINKRIMEAMDEVKTAIEKSKS